MKTRTPLQCLIVAAVIAACASSGGTEIYPGVTFYRSDDASEYARWTGGPSRIPIYVVSSAEGGVTVPRALAVRDGIMDSGPARSELFRIVAAGEIGGDTLGEVLWRSRNSSSRECVSYNFSPGDSITPASRTCNRMMTSTGPDFERWNPGPLMQTAFEAGGNAILLTGEDYSGTFRGLRGFILRCGDGELPPPCG